MEELDKEMKTLEKSNIKLLNEITWMKKREMYILNGEDPEEIEDYKLDFLEIDSRSEKWVPWLNLSKIEEWREKDYLTSLLRKKG